MRFVTTLSLLGLLMLFGAILMGCGEDGVSSTTLPPTISFFSPTSGSGGVTVEILGSRYFDVSSVKFNGVEAASFTVVNDAQITAVTPDGVTTGKISVTTKNGTVESETDFTVGAIPQQPQLASFSPTSGSNVGGLTVGITGSHFTGATVVKFNGTDAASFQVQSDTLIAAVTPAGVATGKISVTTPQGTGESASDFTVGPIPQITSFTPTSGSSFGETTVIISGSHFTDATSVTFGGAMAVSYTVDSDNTITAVTGPGAPGPAPIAVETSTGLGTSTMFFNFDLPII